MPNSDAYAVSAPGHTARLHDGRIVLVYNALENGRQEVELAFSSDEARTWTAPVTVARGKGTTYPFVLEHTPGELWVGFFSVSRGFNQAKAKLMKIAADAVAPTR
ncbi:MAG: sialidase [Verrucomicrobiota bacterium]|nr:sialidase [Verrucomicrobiota bacterium]